MGQEALLGEQSPLCRYLQSALQSRQPQQTRAGTLRRAARGQHGATGCRPCALTTPVPIWGQHPRDRETQSDCFPEFSLPGSLQATASLQRGIDRGCPGEDTVVTVGRAGRWG